MLLELNPLHEHFLHHENILSFLIGRFFEFFEISRAIDLVDLQSQGVEIIHYVGVVSQKIGGIFGAIFLIAQQWEGKVQEFLLNEKKFFLKNCLLCNLNRNPDDSLSTLYDVLLHELLDRHVLNTHWSANNSVDFLEMIFLKLIVSQGIKQRNEKGESLKVLVKRRENFGAVGVIFSCLRNALLESI